MIALALSLAVLQSPAVSERVSVPSAPAPLYGTLLTPAEPRAAAVILPGSGPTDRDGNSPLGITASTYRLLAEALAEDGITTVRIDKRGVGESAAAAAASETDIRFTHYVDDARSWATDLARRTGRPCVWLIGHSEGALIAEAAAQDNAAVCGLVLLSGAGRPAADVLREQLANLPEPLKAQAFAALTELEAGRMATETPPQLAALFRPSVQPYLISWFPFDPAALLAAYDGPVLIAQGTTDIQVSMADADALAAAQPNAERAVFEGVNHVLKTAPLDQAANVATYSNPALPLAPGVAEAVSQFILRPHREPVGRP